MELTYKVRGPDGKEYGPAVWNKSARAARRPYHHANRNNPQRHQLLVAGGNFSETSGNGVADHSAATDTSTSFTGHKRRQTLDPATIAHLKSGGRGSIGSLRCRSSTLSSHSPGAVGDFFLGWE